MALFTRKSNLVTINPTIQRMNAVTGSEMHGIPGETISERHARRLSQWVMHTTTLIMSIGFSIILTGAWPYLQQLSPGTSKEFLGWVIAVNPLGQMIASPLLGLWGNKAESIRGACFVTVLLYMFGNFLYAILAVFGSYAKVMMLVSRFIIGLSSGSVAVCRSYIAMSTTVHERTSATAISAAAMAIGVVIGPSIQTALVVAFTAEESTNDIYHDSNTTIYQSSDPSLTDLLTLNVYNTAGWVSVAIGFINLILFLPCIFKEYNVEKKMQDCQNDEFKIKYPKPDYPAVFGLLIPFFFIFFVNVLIETILVPLCIDMYAWSPLQAVKYAGIGLSIVAAITLFLFLVSGTIAKRLTDRKVLLFLGLIPLTIGLLIFIPMGNTLPKISNCTISNFDELYLNESNSVESITSNNEISQNLTRIKRHATNPHNECYSYGCPPEQKWCFYTPIIEKSQLIIGIFFVTCGYPFIFAIAASIYSKMLGPKPQGLWMGILTSTGSLSRMTGPIFVSYMYTDLGPQWTFGILFILSVIVTVISSMFYKRFVPMDTTTTEREQLQSIQPDSLGQDVLLTSSTALKSDQVNHNES